MDIALSILQKWSTPCFEDLCVIIKLTHLVMSHGQLIYFFILLAGQTFLLQYSDQIAHHLQLLQLNANDSKPQAAQPLTSHGKVCTTSSTDDKHIPVYYFSLVGNERHTIQHA
eukprot:2129176-Amphidinium_carterae.1